jgi:hypothetical protein
MCLRYRTLQGVKRFFLRTVINGESGVELVEAAFVLPVLLMLLLGIVWMGRGYMVYEAITRAAREGARYEVLPSCATCGNAPIDAPSSTCLSTSSNTFTNYIAPALSATGLNPNLITDYCQKTDWLTASADPPRQCGTIISFSYPTVFAIPFTSLKMTTINIATKVQMRNENQPVVTPTTPASCP